MTEAKDRSFESLQVGDTASFEHSILEEELQTFAKLSGDMSPLHVDEAYAAAASYGSRVVHGMFLGALVSRLVGMELPGKRALLVSESLEFKKPVHIGETVRVEGIVMRTSAATQMVELSFKVTVEGVLVAAGEARVLIRTL